MVHALGGHILGTALWKFCAKHCGHVAPSYPWSQIPCCTPHIHTCTCTRGNHMQIFSRPGTLKQSKLICQCTTRSVSQFRSTLRHLPEAAALYKAADQAVAGAASGGAGVPKPQCPENLPRDESVQRCVDYLVLRQAPRLPVAHGHLPRLGQCEPEHPPCQAAQAVAVVAQRQAHPLQVEVMREQGPPNLEARLHIHPNETQPRTCRTA